MLDVLCLGEMSRPSRGARLEIPVADMRESAVFYGRVFGWEIRDRDAEHPGFADPSADLAGTWVARPAECDEDGVLFDLRVDDIEETMARVWTHGGEVVEPPELDAEGGQWIATFRDPAGNLIGLYQDGARE
jgi:predicted enzyme related to lactoylglutathione lyase